MLCVTGSIDEYAVQQPIDFFLKSASKKGLDIDEDEKKRSEELLRGR